jgi:hypothetical protein
VSFCRIFFCIIILDIRLGRKMCGSGFLLEAIQKLMEANIYIFMCGYRGEYEIVQIRLKTQTWPELYRARFRCVRERVMGLCKILKDFHVMTFSYALR